MTACMGLRVSAAAEFFCPFVGAAASLLVNARSVVCIRICLSRGSILNRVIFNVGRTSQTLAKATTLVSQCIRLIPEMSVVVLGK
jgi:hypothetical protein